MKPSAIRVSCGLLPLAIVIAGIKTAPPPDEPPANVAGKGRIYPTSADGKTATKYIDLKQDGEKLSGHFKAPNQSGGRAGTVEDNHIGSRLRGRLLPGAKTRETFSPDQSMLHTKTGNVFTFRGHLDGDRMRGTFGIWLPGKPNCALPGAGPRG